MKRKIYNKLVEWKNQKQHKPLILNDVRQCGKTFILKEFGKKNSQALPTSVATETKAYKPYMRAISMCLELYKD